jgi:predicted PhzF superfamily epimerase YddE/YHI9
VAGTAFAIVDAFTTGQPFSCNPAGVLLLDEFPDPRCMQGAVNGLRWFTPVAEVALCGHATLASAHWLRSAAPCRSGRKATDHADAGERSLLAVLESEAAVRELPPICRRSRVCPSVA